MSKIAVAMSGGVDSSVAAALLKSDRHEVVGVTMRFWECEYTDTDSMLVDGCCGVQGLADAEKVCSILGIPHKVADMQQVFEDKVVTDFYTEYSRGRTPNPCIRCNEHLKFSAFVEWVRNYGIDLISTGHYARIEKHGEKYKLKKGVDENKDQSYVLYSMNQEQLRKTLMPLGGLTKQKVREMAVESGLHVAKKKDSQEICFVPDDDYRGFVSRRMPHLLRSGVIKDSNGKVLGEHNGIINYTIGQRRGLGISASEPLFVIDIDVETNTIVVGSKQETYTKQLVATDVNWIGAERPVQSIRVNARIRYNHQEAPATVSQMSEGRISVTFEEPQMAITPGQAVVLYDNDMVIGGGTIE